MYDLIIIGSGPCGLTASIYSSCFNLKHIVIGKIVGGQMAIAPDIINYPGFEHITGTELTQKMLDQAKKMGGEVLAESVDGIKKVNNKEGEQVFEISTDTGKTFQAKTIILASGTERRKLNVPGETEYTGKGVDYCTSQEHSELKDKTIAIIGGANSAISSAIQISDISLKTYIIYRGGELRCDPIKLEQIKNNPKIEVLYNSVVSEIFGDGLKVTSIKLSPIPSPTSSTSPTELKADKVIIEIGGVPGSALVIPLGVEIDQGGFIKVNEEFSTNIPGIFAAGDVLSSKLSVEQITSAVGLGARAATSVFSYLKNIKAPTLWGKSQIKR